MFYRFAIYFVIFKVGCEVKVFSFMVFGDMLSLCISRPECLLAEVAGNGDSFNVVCLNVVLDIPSQSFLSTNSADARSLGLTSISYHVLAFGHH